MSKNIFNSVQYPKVGSNTFDLSHDVKLSMRMGRLVPSFVMDCVPGDRVRLSSETMLRFAPLVAPVMHRVNVTTHYFFVPNRILWPNWERWITGDLEVEAPFYSNDVQTGGFIEGSLADYMGIPTNVTQAWREPINALPFAAYAKIWDEYYRDQNLQEEIFEPLTDGFNGNGTLLLSFPPKKRAWQHDYFTAALPFAQKGDAVTLPLGNFSDVDVYFNPNGAVDSLEGGKFRYNVGPTYFPMEPSSNANLRLLGGTGSVDANDGVGSPSGSFYDPMGSLSADTSSLETEAADINTLRRAFRLQEWLERNARGGTRYIENIMAHFGVKSSDARINRPEFLGGSYQKMVISEVLSTAETDIPVGNLAGHGISVGSGREFNYYCEEHGWIIGLINVQPVTSYQQGMPRMFSREDRLDYYWPSFANIGEQEVKNKEIFVGNDDLNEETFGYVPRYAEYKYIPSRVAGEMRTSLSQWHLGRIFENRPNLNGEFVSADPSTRIFAVTEDVDHIYGHIFNNCRALRKMPKFGTPTF